MCNTQKNSIFYLVKKGVSKQGGWQMANKKTVALTDRQYFEILDAMKKGSTYFRPNEQIRTILIAEANLGPRIEDILKLKLCDFVMDGNLIKIYITEKKTGKVRNFTVSPSIYSFLTSYCEKNHIAGNVRMFSLTERSVQTYLQKVCWYLDIENVSTHSFRKTFARKIYEQTGNDIVAVQIALQHSSVTTTQRYLNIASVKLDSVLQDYTLLPND